MPPPVHPTSRQKVYSCILPAEDLDLELLHPPAQPNADANAETPPTSLETRPDAPEVMDSDDVFFESLEALDGDNKYTEMDTDEPFDDLVAKLRDIAEQESSSSSAEGDEQLDESPQTDGNGIEIVIPQIPIEKLKEYAEVRSNIVEAIKEELPAQDGQVRCLVEFTDGREEPVGTYTLPLSPEPDSMMLFLLRSSFSYRLRILSLCVQPLARFSSAQVSRAVFDQTLPRILPLPRSL